MANVNETGSVKYNCKWIKSEPVDNTIIEEINHWRDKLFRCRYIGVYPDGIGYGNISIRLKGSVFLISGTSTGNLELLTNQHYTKVTSYSFTDNFLTCEGPIQASAESLTHAAIYESDYSINAVIHIHNKALWDKLLNKVPTTCPNVEYGTPQMAYEIMQLFGSTNLITKKILVMAGHEEGIISFGNNLEEAGKVLIELH